jgi:hypothetical protein
MSRSSPPFERPGDFTEDACNESNYGLEGVLKGARYQDAQAAKVSKTLKWSASGSAVAG